MSRLQETYSPRGFIVVAVNAYDEEKAVVQAFVEKEKLKQVVLLRGRDIAEKLFNAVNFPTSFWVDHEGKVVRRETDFEPAMAPRMERMARKLIDARPAAR